NEATQTTNPLTRSKERKGGQLCAHKTKETKKHTHKQTNNTNTHRHNPAPSRRPRLASPRLPSALSAELSSQISPASLPTLTQLPHCLHFPLPQFYLPASSKLAGRVNLCCSACSSLRWCHSRHGCTSAAEPTYSPGESVSQSVRESLHVPPFTSWIFCNVRLQVIRGLQMKRAEM
ncbi:hypothetical protein KC19_1G312900, partial [Ceratodon purpureus]